MIFSQEIIIDGAIIVSTPQEVALQDVIRGIKIFGEGGVKKTAEEFSKEFLGEIPINLEVRKLSDDKKPIVEANPSHEISKIYLNFAKKIKSTFL